MNKFDSKKLKLFLSVLIILLLITGISFALYNIVFEGQREHSITTAKVSFSYKEQLDSLELLAGEALTDEEGKVQDNYYEFDVKGECDEQDTINYVIYLQEEPVTNSFGANNIKLYLTEVNNNVETEVVEPTLISKLLAVENIANSKALYGDSFTLNNNTETKTYRLRIWLKEEFDLSSLFTSSTNAQGEKNIVLEEYEYKFKVNVKTGEMPVKTTETILSMYQSGDLEIGDFITYDAGTWTAQEIASIQVGPNSSLVSANNSTYLPYNDYQFGGFVAGQSRNAGAEENLSFGGSDYTYAKMYDGDDSSNQVPLSGWRIFDIDETNGLVTLISAANPEDYYHPNVRNGPYISQYILTGTKDSNWSGNISNYTKRDWSMYENSRYNATNARVLTKTELDNWYNKYMGVTSADTYTSSTFQLIYSSPYLSYQNLIDNHSFYWLGSAYGSACLYNVYPLDRSVFNFSDRAFGVRPLVSIPLTSTVQENPVARRTITLDGMSWENGTYGAESVQEYNVWDLAVE